MVPRYLLLASLSLSLLVPSFLMQSASAQMSGESGDPMTEAMYDIADSMAAESGASFDQFAMGAPEGGFEGMIPPAGAEDAPAVADGDEILIAHVGGGGMHSPLHALQGANALTDDQYEKLYALHNQFMDQHAPKMLQLHSLERQMRDSLSSADLDSKKIQDLSSRIASLKADLSSQMSNHLLAAAQILTADQRRELRKHMVRGSLMGGHEHGGWGHGPMMMHHFGQMHEHEHEHGPGPGGPPPGEH